MHAYIPTLIHSYAHIMTPEEAEEAMQLAQENRDIPLFHSPEYHHRRTLKKFSKISCTAHTK